MTTQHQDDGARNTVVSRRELFAVATAALVGGATLGAESAASCSFTATVSAADHEVEGTDGICWIELKLEDGTSISIGGPSNTPLLKWLASRRGQTVGGALG